MGGHSAERADRQVDDQRGRLGEVTRPEDLPDPVLEFPPGQPALGK
jgi:hypothetical protein